MSDNLVEQKTPEQIVEKIREELGSTGGWRPDALGATELGRENKKLRKQINIDPLTGLSTEYPLNDMINGLQKRWENDSKKGVFLEGTFIVADMDDLHEINRKYGERKGGDDFFRAVGEVFKSVARDYGLRCFRDRHGTDTFILYLPGDVPADRKNEIISKTNRLLEIRERRDKEIYSEINYNLSYSDASFHQFCSPRDAYNEAFDGIKESKTVKK